MTLECAARLGETILERALAPPRAPRAALVDAALGEIERFLVEMAEQIHARGEPVLEAPRDVKAANG